MPCKRQSHTSAQNDPASTSRGHAGQAAGTCSSGMTFSVGTACAGILGMPNGPFLYADQLLDVLTAKSEQGGFRSVRMRSEQH